MAGCKLRKQKFFLTNASTAAILKHKLLLELVSKRDSCGRVANIRIMFKTI